MTSIEIAFEQALSRVKLCNVYHALRSPVDRENIRWPAGYELVGRVQSDDRWFAFQVTQNELYRDHGWRLSQYIVPEVAKSRVGTVRSTGIGDIIETPDGAHHLVVATTAAGPREPHFEEISVEQFRDNTLPTQVNMQRVNGQSVVHLSRPQMEYQIER